MPRTTFSPRGNTPQNPPPPPPPPATGGGTTPQTPTPGGETRRWNRYNPPRALTGLRPGYGPRSGVQMNRPVFMPPKTEPQTVIKTNGGGGTGGDTGGGGDDQTKVIAPFWTRPAALYFLGALIVLPLIFKKLK